MKFPLLLASLSIIAAAAFAQEQQQPAKKAARIETIHEHRGASHTHTHTVVPAEHHSTSSWHYHSGPKRAQVAVDGMAADSVKKK